MWASRLALPLGIAAGLGVGYFLAAIDHPNWGIAAATVAGSTLAAFLDASAVGRSSLPSNPSPLRQDEGKP
jgi:hypothetical protein